MKAEPDPHRSSVNADAHDQFERGVALARAGDLVSAVEAFEAAYRLSPKYPVLYNLGQALAALGRWIEAKQALETYLADGGDAIAPDRRRRVEELIESQQRHIGFLLLRSEQQGAELTIDGQSVGSTPLPEPVPLIDGRHQVVAVLPGFRVFTEHFQIAPGTTTEVSVVLRPEPPPPAEAERLRLELKPEWHASSNRRILTAIPLATSSPNRRDGKGWMIATGVSGVALGALAASLKIWNQGRYEDWHRDRVAVDGKLATAQEDATTRQQRLNLYDRAASIQLVDDAALSAAVVSVTALVTFGILWLTDGSAPKPKR